MNPSGQNDRPGAHPSRPKSAWFWRLIGHEDSLRRKTIVGGQWLLLKYGVMASLELVRAAVFARVLFPEDYGLMALAMLAIGFLESFTATGIEVMVQQEGDDYREKLAAYWTIKFVRGVVLTGLAWLVAVPVSEFYGKPELAPLIRLLGMAFLIRGCGGFGREIRQRHMEFRRVALVDSVSAGVEIALGLAALFLIRDVWALAAYALISAGAATMCSYVLFPWRPRFARQPALLKRVGVFAVSMTLLNIFNYLFTSLDVGTIGKLLGLDPLGYYARGNFLALLPAVSLSNIVASVLLSVFRGIAEDHARLRRVVVTTLLVLGGAYVALGIVLAGLAGVIVTLVYGERWLPVVPVFRITLIYGVSKGIVALTVLVFFIKEKPWLATVCAGVMAAMLAALCVPLTRRFGLEGTAWAVVVAGLCAHALALLLMGRLLGGTGRGAPVPAPRAAAPETCGEPPRLGS